MHLLERRSFVLKPKAWAKKLRRSKRIDAAFKSWLHEDIVSKLQDAFVEVFLSKMKTSEVAAQAKASADAASSSSQQSSAAPSSASAKTDDAKSHSPTSTYLTKSWGKTPNPRLRMYG